LGILAVYLEGKDVFEHLLHIGDACFDFFSSLFHYLDTIDERFQGSSR